MMIFPVCDRAVSGPRPAQGGTASSPSTLDTDRKVVLRSYLAMRRNNCLFVPQHRGHDVWHLTSLNPPPQPPAVCAVLLSNALQWQLGGEGSRLHKFNYCDRRMWRVSQECCARTISATITPSPQQQIQKQGGHLGQGGCWLLG